MLVGKVQLSVTLFWKINILFSQGCFCIVKQLSASFVFLRNNIIIAKEDKRC